MGAKNKIRNNKRQKIEERKRDEVKKKNETNPFELKRNKIKHNVLGRKIAKNEIGKPLLNRSRAIQKRTQTLLKEYQNKHKCGKGLRDLRSVNAEERIVTKYKDDQRDVTFNDDEKIELTHKGKPLEEFIDDRLSSDDEDIDLFNRENYVETTHFGGGDDGAPRSTSDVLNSILDEKREKKQAREENILLTQQLDDQWGEIKSLIRHKGSNQNTVAEGREEYDNLINQLMFESKKPSIQQSETVLPKPLQINEQNLPQTPDTLLKSKLKSIQSSNDIKFITKLLKEALNLLSKVTYKSFDFLKDRLIKLSESNLKFTPNEICILIISSYFKELQVLNHLLILKTLYKLKYSTYHEVAVSVFLNNFLLRSIYGCRFYPELFTHVDNLVRLCLPFDKIKLKLFHRLNFEANCILNIEKQQTNSTNLETNSNYSVTLFTLFERVFVNVDKDEHPLVEYNLTIQIIQLAIGLFDKYSKLPITQKLMIPIKIKIEDLVKYSDNNGKLSALFEDFLNRFNEATPIPIVNEIRPKPFILPMLEPSFETDGSKWETADRSKSFDKKYKREFKGAQREIRKDARFMHNTYLKEIEKKDRIRKNKVKALLQDLSVQQGLYKKK